MDKELADAFIKDNLKVGGGREEEEGDWEIRRCG